LVGIAEYNPHHDVSILANTIHDGGSTTCPNSGSAAISVNTLTSGTGNGLNNNIVVNGNKIYNIAVGAPACSAAAYGFYEQGVGTVYTNNIVVGVGAGFCWVSYHQASNEIITNNIFANCGRGGIEISNDTSGTPNKIDFSTVTNNIVVNNGANGGQQGIQEFGSGCTAVGANNLYVSNLLYGNSPSDWGLCAGHTHSGDQTGNNASVFVNYQGNGSGDYHSPNGSSAIDNGTTVCANGVSSCVPAVDFDGNVRPDSPGTNPDIGAYEKSGS
jgi:hypothetical protein